MAEISNLEINEHSNLERPNLRGCGSKFGTTKCRPIFQNFEILNIIIMEVELFDFSIFEFIFYFYVFLNYSNTQNTFMII